MVVQRLVVRGRADGRDVEHVADGVNKRVVEDEREDVHERADTGRRGDVERAPAFRADPPRRSGHALERGLELVNLRVAVDVEGAAPDFSVAADPALSLPSTPDSGIPLHDQGQLAPGEMLAGPAIVLSAVGTTFIEAGWQGRRDALGNLHLARPIPAT